MTERSGGTALDLSRNHAPLPSPHFHPQPIQSDVALTLPTALQSGRSAPAVSDWPRAPRIIGRADDPASVFRSLFRGWLPNALNDMPDQRGEKVTLEMNGETGLARYVKPFSTGPLIVGTGGYWAATPTGQKGDDTSFRTGRLIARPAPASAGDGGVNGGPQASGNPVPVKFIPATDFHGRQGLNNRGEILGYIEGGDLLTGATALWRNGRGHPLDSLAATAKDRTTDTRVPVLLLPIDIEPDANMSGVVGDVVKSAKAGSTVKHFVTPRKSTELNQEYVILKAVGVTVDQITDGNASQIVEWDGGLPTDPPDPLKRRVKRDATGNGPTEVKIKTKQGGTVAVQMDVWVVWCTMNAQHSRFGSAIPVIYENETVFEAKRDNGNRFRFIIHPAAIVSPQADAEIRDLKGAKRKPVPGDGKPFTIHMGPNPPVGDTAANKWDVSRQYSITISNPNLIPLAQPAPELFPAWLVGQPNAAD